MTRILSIAMGVAVAVASLGIVASPAAAHEQHQVGMYTVEMGWHVEPALEGVVNAVYLEVRETATDKPVEDLAKTLRVQVTFGGGVAAFEPALHALADTPGAYVGDIIPTRAGDYRFRLSGTIGDLKVDERFESGPGRFDPVSARGALAFPDAVPAAALIAKQQADADAKLNLAIALAAIALVLSVASFVLALRRR